MAGTETATRQREAGRQTQNTQIKKEKVRDREKQRTKPLVLPPLRSVFTTSAFCVHDLPAMSGHPISELSWVDAAADSAVSVMFTMSPCIPELTSVSSMHYIKLSVHVVVVEDDLSTLEERGDNVIYLIEALAESVHGDPEHPHPFPQQHQPQQQPAQ